MDEYRSEHSKVKTQCFGFFTKNQLRINSNFANRKAMGKSRLDAQFSAELIAFLARLARTTDEEIGLNSAQRAALRYFACATRTSCTVTAFADYHVTTRGTASQTIKGLVLKGLLSRTPSLTDGRVSRVSLTPKGRALYEKDPMQKLAQTIAKLAGPDRENLTTILETLTRSMAEDQQKRQFGLCHRCLHLRESIELDGEEATHFCRLIREPLSRSDLTAICMDYRALTS